MSYLDAIDDVMAAYGPPSVAVTQPTVLRGEDGRFERQCWVWFVGSRNHHLRVDRYPRRYGMAGDQYEVTAGSHTGRPTATVRGLWPPTADKVRAVLALAEFIHDLDPTPGQDADADRAAELAEDARAETLAEVRAQ